MTEGRRPTRRRRKRKQKKKAILLDLHFRVGFEDQVVRISPADWQKIITYWMCGQEDIILRGPYKNMETDFVLRGSSSGRIAIREADPKTQLHRYQVIRVHEVQQDMLEKQGL